jgi:peptidylprolyl isomerase
MPLRTLALVTVAVIALDLSTAAAQDVTSDKGKLSCAIGYKTGIDIARLIERGEQADIASIIKGLQDAAAKRDPAVPAEQLAQSMDNMQRRLAARAKAEFEKLAADNETKSDAFLAQYRQRAGVKAQPSGVLQREITAGSGSRPTQESLVRIAHKGTKPDGTVILNTETATGGQPAGYGALPMFVGSARCDQS